ncbi:MAG TPA: hypothetical protein DCG38_06095 [Eubacteriaceae bacterium]|jgi:PII-like signaling protein|nr:hypothetical protein [Eubacteriaceae bacterium]
MSHTNGRMLKIFVGESEMYNHEALYHAIIKKLKEHGMAGATTIRGIEGFGAHNIKHKKAIDVLSGDLPILIEVIDSPEKIDEIIDTIKPMIKEGMMAVINGVEIV